ncbi:hypothetical protein EDC01DRAFT_714634 [Geopyxis carbonaria]|nr:hypothetical protein EDC01DRAFT_714634 [Geopyxis carbonaria]
MQLLAPLLRFLAATTSAAAYNQTVSTDYTAHLPSNITAAALSLPVPPLTADFRIHVATNPVTRAGAGPWGTRNWISFSGGTWSAAWGHGTVLAGGQDSQLIISDLSARLEANYVLQTADAEPAFIVVKTQGWRTGQREVLERLMDPETASGVGVGEYRFRLFVQLETGDSRYDWVSTRMWVGSGAKRGDGVVYDAYLVD